MHVLRYRALQVLGYGLLVAAAGDLIYAAIQTAWWALAWFYHGPGAMGGGRMTQLVIEIGMAAVVWFCGGLNWFVSRRAAKLKSYGLLITACVLNLIPLLHWRLPIFFVFYPAVGLTGLIVLLNTRVYDAFAAVSAGASVASVVGGLPPPPPLPSADLEPASNRWDEAAAPNSSTEPAAPIVPVAPPPPPPAPQPAEHNR